MNSDLAFFISIFIWMGEMFSFVWYVNTQSILSQGITTSFMLISMVLMWVALGLITKDDLKSEKKLIKKKFKRNERGYKKE